MELDVLRGRNRKKYNRPEKPKWNKDVGARHLRRSEHTRREELEVVLELPNELSANRIRKLRIVYPATAKDISEELTKKYKVNNRWKLFGSSNINETPRKLEDNNSLDNYRLDKNPNARLYFYPEIPLK